MNGLDQKSMAQLAHDACLIGNLAKLCDLRKIQLRTENLECNLYQAES